jgi:hypothetical protein
MPFRCCVAAIVLLSSVPATPALAQRAADARAAFSYTSSAPQVGQQAASCRIGLRPFVLWGAAAGAVYGTWWYIDALIRSDVGDMYFPLSVIIVVGGAAVVGVLAGYIVGNVVQAAYGCAPV